MDSLCSSQPELLPKHTTVQESISCGDFEIERHKIGDKTYILRNGVVISENPSAGYVFFEKEYSDFTVNVFYNEKGFFDTSIDIIDGKNLPDNIKKVILLPNNEVIIGYGDNPLGALLIASDGNQKKLPGIKGFHYPYFHEGEGVSYEFGGRRFYNINPITPVNVNGVCVDEDGRSLSYGDRKIVGIDGILEDTVFGKVLVAKVDVNHVVFFDEDFDLIEDKIQLDTGDEWYILDRLGNQIGPYQEITIIPAINHPKYEGYERGPYNLLLVDNQGNVFDCKSIIYEGRKVAAMSDLPEGYRLHFEDGTILDILEEDLLRYMLTKTVKKMNELLNY